MNLYTANLSLARMVTESQISKYSRAEKRAMAAKSKEEAAAILRGLKKPEYRHYSAADHPFSCLSYMLWVYGIIFDLGIGHKC